MKKLRQVLQMLLLSLALAMIVPSVVPTIGGATVQAASVKINKKKATLIKGQTLKLKITGTSKKVKWSSNKKSVATVSSKGKVTAKKVGTATITAKVGNKKYKCKVTVKAATVDVTGVSINKTTLTVKEGESETLSASISPTNATNQTITWSSTNSSIAMVSSDGKVTGMSVGTATITAVCSGKVASCTVTVAQNFDEDTALSKLSINSYKVEDDRYKGVVIIIKNNYKYDVDIDVDCLYYNESGALLGKRSDCNYCLESGTECALYTYGVYDSNYNYVDWTSYELSVKVSEVSTSVIRNQAGISYTSNYGADNVMVTVTNNGVKTDYTKVAVVFLKNGSVIGYSSGYADVDAVGETDYVSFSYPYNENYDRITPDDYKVYVNWSYTYTWNS